jgi:hypothetical protein
LRSFSSTRWIERARRAVAHRGGDLADDVGLRLVDDCVDRVEPQAVKAELLEPVERVVDEEPAHRAGEVDRGAPRRRAAPLEELRGVEVQVVAVGPEMVVDHVEQHHQAPGVRRIDQALEVRGRAVARVRRERQHAVVAPAALAGEVADRHQLERGDAEVGEVVEPVERGGERAARGEGADVQLVHDRLGPRPSRPAVVVPLVVERIDHPARRVHVVRVPARRRIGHSPVHGGTDSRYRHRPAVGGNHPF